MRRPGRRNRGEKRREEKSRKKREELPPGRDLDTPGAQYVRERKELAHEPPNDEVTPMERRKKSPCSTTRCTESSGHARMSARI